MAPADPGGPRHGLIRTGHSAEDSLQGRIHTDSGVDFSQPARAGENRQSASCNLSNGSGSIVSCAIFTFPPVGASNLSASSFMPGAARAARGESRLLISAAPPSLLLTFDKSAVTLRLVVCRGGAHETDTD